MADPHSGGSPVGRVRLSKEERRALLARIEQEASRAESPARIVQRAEEALEGRQLGQARRLVDQLVSRVPGLTGLAELEVKLAAVEKEQKLQSNIRTAEEMLTRYIQQRQKKMATLALETLLEIAPEHPRRKEYEIWVRDLDEELAFQRQIDEQVAAGQAALRRGDMEEAQRRLEALRQLDPDSPATDGLAEEMSRTERGQAESADIERIKQKAEELMVSGRVEEAEAAIEQLAGKVPKITLDFLRKRLDQARGRRQVGKEMEILIAEFRRDVEKKDWLNAREVARRFGEQFPDSGKAAEMFNEVHQLEAAERKKQSIEQGIASFRQFIAKGQRSEAELALKLLRNLDIGPDRLAEFEAQLASLG